MQQVGILAQADLHQNIEPAVTNLGGRACLVARPGVGATAMQLAARHREIHLGAALVAVDDPEARSQQRILSGR